MFFGEIKVLRRENNIVFKCNFSVIGPSAKLFGWITSIIVGEIRNLVTKIALRFTSHLRAFVLSINYQQIYEDLLKSDFNLSRFLLGHMKLYFILKLFQSQTVDVINASKLFKVFFSLIRDFLLH